VNLYGWFIDDVADSGSAPIGISGIIGPKAYKQFYLSDSFLNNSGDDIRLLNGNKIEKNKTTFISSTKGKSWSRDNAGNWCQIDPTPNSSNPNCPTSSPTIIPTPTPSVTPLGASPTPTPTSATSPRPSGTSVGTSTPPNPSPITPQVLGKSNEKNNFTFQVSLVVMGILTLGVSGWMFWHKSWA